jgi:hypothetical protein
MIGDGIITGKRRKVRLKESQVRENTAHFLQVPWLI